MAAADFATVLFVLGALMACTFTAVAFGGKRFVALCGYSCALYSFSNALGVRHAPDWERLPLIIVATVLLVTALALGATGHGTRRPASAADAPVGEPEDEIPAGYRTGKV